MTFQVAICSLAPSCVTVVACVGISADGEVCTGRLGLSCGGVGSGAGMYLGMAPLCNLASVSRKPVPASSCGGGGGGADFSRDL